MYTVDEFDMLLYEGAARLPPDLPVPEPPKPWKKPLNRICWGLVLISITLSFLSLDIILPVVGAVLLWLGLRSLRLENSGFRFACACAAAYAVLRLSAVVLLATPLDLYLSERIGMEWHNGQGSVPIHHVLRLIVLQSTLTLTVGGLWRGLKAVFVAAGQKPRTAAAGGLVVLEALMIPLSLIGLEGWLPVGPVLLLWVLLLRSLWKLSRSLDEAGYALTPAPVRLPGWAAFGLWLGIPLLALALLPLGFNRLPVHDSTPVCGPDVRDEALYRELLDLGFPEDLLSRLEHDLGSTGLSRLQGAYGLTVKNYDTKDGIYPDCIPKAAVLEVPVRDERYGFHNVYLAYLHWDAREVSDCRYMEGIRVTPDWHHVSVHATCPEGKLNWTGADGKYHEAPLSFSFRSNGSTASYCADFSLPGDADGPVDGWVYWELAPSFPENVAVFNYGLDFAHRLTPWQYPYTLPSNVLLSQNGGTGWRLMQRPHTGWLAPEGQYQPDPS